MSRTEYTEKGDSGGDTVCPTCGEDGFSSAQYMKTHHALAHGESLAETVVECAWCGQEKPVNDFFAENHERHFCDYDCSHEWQSENWKDGRHPGGAGVSVVVICDYCGGDKRMPEAHAARSERHFCDNSCQGKWLSENNVGENNWNWRGGRSRYGEGWNEEKREEVRENQHRRCAGCDVHEAGLPTKLSVHHINKARRFEEATARNAITNLVALCRPCHKKWEKMSPLRPTVATADGEKA